jgi:hypothetical protein
VEKKQGFGGKYEKIFKDYKIFKKNNNKFIFYKQTFYITIINNNIYRVYNKKPLQYTHFDSLIQGQGSVFKLKKHEKIAQIPVFYTPCTYS